MTMSVQQPDKGRLVDLRSVDKAVDILYFHPFYMVSQSVEN